MHQEVVVDEVQRATAASWFSTFLLKPFVKRGTHAGHEDHEDHEDHEETCTDPS
jgi:hypothetical protein